MSLLSVRRDISFRGGVYGKSEDIGLEVAESARFCKSVAPGNECVEDAESLSAFIEVKRLISPGRRAVALGLQSFCSTPCGS